MDNDYVIESVDYLTDKFKRALKDAKYRAKKKGIEFNLDFDYLRDLFKEQNAKCFYSGMNFDPNSKRKTMSLDRVDSNQGYVRGNVVWCLADINVLKFTRTYEETMKLCKTFIFYQPDWKLMNRLCRNK